MREILFRGQTRRKGEKVWMDGTPVESNWVYGGIFPGTGDFSVIYTFDPIEKRPVYSDTIGQFTGLTDKNGKKIFEGDVIQFHKHRYEPDWVGVVKYENCLYIAAGRMPLAYEKRIGEEPYFCPFEVQISGIDKTTIKVIGNIHDNPELLEVTDNANL